MRQLCKKNKLLLKAVLSPGHNDGSKILHKGSLTYFRFEKAKKCGCWVVS